MKGVQPGDALEIEFIDVQPQPAGFSCIIPGLGFLRDVMKEPFLVHWKIDSPRSAGSRCRSASSA